jgi:competence protein ComEA
VPLLAGLALAIGVAGWFALRAAPRAVPAPEVRTTPVATVSPGSAATGTSASPSPGGTVVVDVAGRVRRPGIARLPAGSRVVDALRQAGGARGGVDLSSLNLARVLVDGEQILVGPVPGGAGPTQAGPGPAGGPAGQSGRVSLNSADLAQLETLPGVGPVTAQKILDWRAEHGAFSSVDELLEVDGIGAKTLAEISPHATL